MSHPVNYEILERIYGEIQEEFPNLSINEWENMAKQRFEELPEPLDLE